MEKPFEVFATEKGQVVIPAALRVKYGIKKGTKILIFDFDGEINLAPQTVEHRRKIIANLRGSLKGSGLLKAHMEGRAREIEKEEKELAEWKAKKTSRV